MAGDKELMISESGAYLPKWLMVTLVVGAFSFGSVHAATVFMVNSNESRIDHVEDDLTEHKKTGGHPLMEQEMSRVTKTLEKLEESFDRMDRNIVKICTKNSANCTE